MYRLREALRAPDPGLFCCRSNRTDGPGGTRLSPRREPEPGGFYSKGTKRLLKQKSIILSSQRVSRRSLLFRNTFWRYRCTFFKKINKVNWTRAAAAFRGGPPRRPPGADRPRRRTEDLAHFFQNTSQLGSRQPWKLPANATFGRGTWLVGGLPSRGRGPRRVAARPYPSPGPAAGPARRLPAPRAHPVSEPRSLLHEDSRALGSTAEQPRGAHSERAGVAPRPAGLPASRLHSAPLPASGRSAAASVRTER